MAAITCDRTAMNLERLSARSFVVFGGLFWTIAAFAGLYSFGGAGLPLSVANALLPLAITIAALAVGWFYERTAAVLLTAGAVAIVVWGAFMVWGPVVWMLMLAFLVAPMLIAATLFYLAARMDTACQNESVTGPHEMTA
ncbi:MAG: hypothetical protein HY876_10170 [Coriobacteriales bacterium]|nr:hypothetical protein [Coriobacteriales bacterium]